MKIAVVFKHGNGGLLCVPNQPCEEVVAVKEAARLKNVVGGVHRVANLQFEEVISTLGGFNSSCEYRISR